MKFTIYQESRLGTRKNNEDRMAYSYSRDALLMIVADGMGGHYYGEIAAQIAVQTLVDVFQRAATPSVPDPFLFLQTALINAHSAILDFAESRLLKDLPRTTCVACLVQDNVAYWAHVGDSRLYLIRDTRVLHRTRDHSRVQLLLEQGVINEAQAALHPERNKIYSCLGSPLTPDIEFSRKTPLEAGDLLLLCTDGLWTVIPETTLVARLQMGDLSRAIPALLDETERRGGQNVDNMSVVVARWEDTYSAGDASSPSVISTQGMRHDTITTRLDAFGRNPQYKSELSEDEIERAIEEIRATIQKYSK